MFLQIFTFKANFMYKSKDYIWTLYIIIIIIIITPCKFFIRFNFHWSLSDSKSTQVFTMPADLNNAVVCSECTNYNQGVPMV